MGTVLRGGAAGGLSADCAAHCVSHRAQCESHRGARVQKKLPCYRVDLIFPIAKCRDRISALAATSWLSPSTENSAYVPVRFNGKPP
jgi:hypothetical protein